MAKSKYIVHLCAYCHRETKMELVGETQSSEQESAPSKAWYRCTRCKHSALVDRSRRGQTKNAAAGKVDLENCVEYAQDKTFDIGQTIHHAGLDDVGLVTGKVKISNGIHAINVSFEKLGERRLVESLPYSAADESVAGIASEA